MLNLRDAKSDSSPIVLVVDDEHEILEEMRLTLIRKGYSCVTAASSANALDVLKRSPKISLVLCDIKMPHMDGLEFIQLARKQIESSRIVRFAVITGHPSLDVAISCIRLGVSDFIAKPIRQSMLFGAIEQMMQDVKTLQKPAEPYKQISSEELKKLWREVDELSSHLKLLVCESEPENSPRARRPQEKGGDVLSPETLASLLKVRAARHLYFNSDLFSDPAWDMMLDLMLAKLRSQKVPVTALCATSGAPQATAHRRIQLLEENGLITRNRDSADSRRVVVELTQEGESKMRGYLERVLHKNWPV